MDNIKRLPQDRETYITRQRNGFFHYRYAYSRSTDTKNAHDIGQDFLLFAPSERRFAFALCDGVSQSFYGDLAARILGEKLLEWFSVLDTEQHEESISTLLFNELILLAEDATSLIRDFDIPENVPDFVHPALEKKRNIGSESTFVAGVVDIDKGKACFAWMGDSRLKVWLGKDELSKSFDGKFLTGERWSTRKGPVGELHVAVLPVSDFDHFITYSDGLAILDKKLKRFRNKSANPLSDAHIADAIETSGRLPSSDDISYLDLWIGIEPPKYPEGKTNSTKPVVKKEEIDKLLYKFSWNTLSGASFYEIEIRSSQGVMQTFETKDVCWSNETELPPQASSLVVRGWWGEEPGSWGEPISVNDPKSGSRPKIAEIIPEQTTLSSSAPSISLQVPNEIPLPSSAPPRIPEPTVTSTRGPSSLASPKTTQRRRTSSSDESHLQPNSLPELIRNKKKNNLVRIFLLGSLSLMFICAGFAGVLVWQGREGSFAGKIRSILVSETPTPTITVTYTRMPSTLTYTPAISETPTIMASPSEVATLDPLTPPSAGTTPTALRELTTTPMPPSLTPIPTMKSPASPEATVTFTPESESNGSSR